MDANAALKNRRGDLPVDLRVDEKLLAKAVISNGIYWRAGAVLLLAALFFLFAPPLGMFLSFVAMVIFLFFHLMKIFLILAVTDQRVILRSGILKIDTIQIRIERIESVEVQRTLMGQILGYATIIITGTGSRLAYIPYIENAQTVRDALDDILYKRDQVKPAI
jgi:uncharacterized membrane protein YdbT with pleckstrin-like domain